MFSDLSFEIASGQALALTGRNGAGKTTLLRVIAGLLHYSAGSLELTGADAEASIGEQAHYVGHQDALKPSLSVGENLRFWAVYLGGQASIDAALATVGLDELADLPAGYLSAGQRRRLALARLVCAPRPVWLLDEPTATLDTASQDKLGELMRGHLATGGMIVAATHGPLPLATTNELRLGAH